MKSISTLIAGLFAFLLLAGCASPEVSPRKIACKVDDPAKQTCSEPERQHRTMSRERP